LISYTDAICLGHRDGLSENQNSFIIGLGVNYPNGADGTTKGLAIEFPDRVLDCPVSESAVTGMCVGMGAMNLNPIIHHGRVEFALLAMDQILTQAAKWNFMFGGDYHCRFGARLNIGRQWGNGPQHTSSYNSLFANTPGLDVFWPSRPSEAYNFIRNMHTSKNPTLHMEHRWLFKTSDNIPNDALENKNPIASVYGKNFDILILTYGDGLIEALRVKEALTDQEVGIICLSGFVNNREVNHAILDLVSRSSLLIMIDTSNFEFGLMQAFLGQLALQRVLPKELKVFSPPFTPVATAAKLVSEYYPTAPNVVEYLNSIGITKNTMTRYNFDEVNLPPNFNFCDYIPDLIIHHQKV
jgi:pyruvate/2-oxoglutarate/acetoin dehydrogenase E1 component